MITGVGVISGLGNNAGEFWSAISAGRSGIGPITKVDPEKLRFKNAAEVKGFDERQHFDDKALLWLDPFSHYGIVSAREAIKDSGIEFDEDLRGTDGCDHRQLPRRQDDRGRAVSATLRREPGTPSADGDPAGDGKCGVEPRVAWSSA